MDEIFEGFFGCFAVLVVIAAAIALLYIGEWAINDRRSFDAQAACLQRRMKPERKSFSAVVVCVPDATRRDTTAVEVKVNQ